MADEIVVTDIGIYRIPGKKICMHHLERKDLQCFRREFPMEIKEPSERFFL